MSKSTAPCPVCAHSGAETVGFTWWGGMIGSMLLSHVECTACGARYNGRTGRSNLIAIIIYNVVVAIIAIAILVAIFWN